MKRIVLSWMVLSSFSLLAKPYKHYLDSALIEKQLAQIAPRPRLMEDQWLKILRFDKDRKFQIHPGDNLWTISKNTLGNPFLWAKLWEENPWLTNPHDIPIGQTLSFYHPSLTASENRSIPVVKLRPEKAGSVTDVDNDIVLHRVLKARYRLNYLIVTDAEILGELTGSYSAKNHLTTQDEIYATFNDSSQIQEGKTFAVVREEKELRDKTRPGKPSLGNLMRWVGEAKVLSFEGNIAKVELTAQFFPVKRDDKVMALPLIRGGSMTEFPSKDLIPQVVMLDEFEKTISKQGDLIFLNRGNADGMKEGFLFKIFSDTDPLNQNREGILPASKGEVRVVYVGEQTSVGIITRNIEPIRIGDSLLSYPELGNRPVPPKKKVREIEID